MLWYATKEDALKKVFEYDSFRGVQAEAIDAVLSGLDVLVVQSTWQGGVFVWTQAQRKSKTSCTLL